MAESAYERARRLSTPSARDLRWKKVQESGEPFSTDQFVAHSKYDDAENRGEFQGESGSDLESHLWGKVVNSYVPNVDPNDLTDRDHAMYHDIATARHGVFLKTHHGDSPIDDGLSETSRYTNN